MDLPNFDLPYESVILFLLTIVGAAFQPRFISQLVRIAAAPLKKYGMLAEAAPTMDLFGSQSKINRCTGMDLSRIKQGHRTVCLLDEKADFSAA